ncbi:THUMP domain-containing protein [Hirsutella rhossiliensis]|uniref:THUMP domain-containing protein n=1 Tax=Hirsutella rhossiliensis TaxID=111463 RepID=A0A9P8MMU7_9HYPO|nr:THUMP domain-containing protein [Hirsutella rhossiliensis]KAH0957975.1 THUMP domain-containing protein [Hirsutella rhossiliensis]
MTDRAQKRKQGPNGADGAGSAQKKSKGGNAGRWKTPHHKAKMAERVDMGSALDVGDQGIWVTFVRGMKTKAVREFQELCDEYGEGLYNIKQPGTDDASTSDNAGEGQGIEASIEDELSSMREQRKPKPERTFAPISTGLECLFFMKTRKPVQPEDLARKICEDARDCPDPRQRKCRYINRLTPVFDTDKATENGIVRLARKVLAPSFSLKGESEADAGATGEPRDADSSPACTFAIRHNIRNHTALKSDEVKKMIASVVGAEHKVNLSNPDKVILVEIFQLFCGISVVDGREWEALKRYNVNSLYVMPRAGETDKAGGSAQEQDSAGKERREKGDKKLCAESAAS